MMICYSTTTIYLLLALLSSIGECRDRRIQRHKVSIVGTSSSESFKTKYNYYMTLDVGSPLNLTCLVRNEMARELRLSWHMLGFRKGIQHQKGFNTLSIIFDQVDLDHTGEYQCNAKGIWDESHREQTFTQKIQLNVIQKESRCEPGAFQCAPSHCISMSKVCDSVIDCLNGEDEDLRQCGPDPCESKLHCADGRCMDTKFCCNPDYDTDCTYVPKCCKALIEFHRNFNNMDMKFLQISEEDNHFHSTILTVIACSTVFLIVFGFIFAIGIYHSRNSWIHQFRRPQPRVRNTYYISNRVHTLEPPPPPPIHRPPSYRAIFGSADDPPPPYSEEFSSSDGNPDLNNNNGDINGNSELVDNHEVRMREELLIASLRASSSSASRDYSSDDTN